MSHCLKSRACVLFIFVTQQPMECWNMVGAQSVCWMNIPFPTPHTRTHWSSTILACFLVGGTFKVDFDLHLGALGRRPHKYFSWTFHVSRWCLLENPVYVEAQSLARRNSTPMNHPQSLIAAAGPRSFQQEHKCQQNETISTAWSQSK